MTTKKEKDKNMFERAIDTIFYSTGLVCAKAIALKNFMVLEKATEKTKDIFEKTKESSVRIAQKAKESAREIKDSFTDGFRGEGVAQEELPPKKDESAKAKTSVKVAVSEPWKPAPTIEEPVVATKKKKIKSESNKKPKSEKASKEDGVETSRKSKHASKEVFNEDFEKEIAKIDKTVAQV